MRELVSIAGATGSGKSTKLRELVSAHRHAVAICKPAHEEKGAWRRHGFHVVSNLPELSRALARSWRGGFRLALFPSIDNQAAAVDRTAHLLWGYSNQERLPRLALAVDELAFCFSNAHAMTRTLTGLKTLILDGRHLNCSLYGASQRPQDVAALWRDECQRRFYFMLQGRAREAVIEDIGREHSAALPREPFHFVEWHGGRLTQGVTRR
jgi:hypothetical protein